MMAIAMLCIPQPHHQLRIYVHVKRLNCCEVMIITTPRNFLQIHHMYITTIQHSTWSIINKQTIRAHHLDSSWVHLVFLGEIQFNNHSSLIPSNQSCCLFVYIVNYVIKKKRITYKTCRELSILFSITSVNTPLLS